MKTYRVVPNTKGTVRMYRTSGKHSGFTRKSTLSKKTAGRSKFRFIYTKKK